MVDNPINGASELDDLNHEINWVVERMRDAFRDAEANGNPQTKLRAIGHRDELEQLEARRDALVAKSRS